jgi:hypothetical protein
MIAQHEIDKAAKELLAQQDRARLDAARQEVIARLEREQQPENASRLYRRSKQH